MAKNVIINGVEYQNVPSVKIPLASDTSGNAEFFDTSDATLASGNQMLSGVTAYSNGTKYTGSIATKTSSDMTVSGASVTAPAGYYATAQSKSVASGTVVADNKDFDITLTDSNISISSAGKISVNYSVSHASSATVTAGYVTEATLGRIDIDVTGTKQLTTQGATTFTPGTSNQTIDSGKYLTGVQTILGDPDLVPANILKNVSIFGVTGTLALPLISQDSTTKVLSIS